MQEYETLKRLVAEAEEDVAKAIGGNKAAGTRVRSDTSRKLPTANTVMIQRIDIPLPTWSVELPG